MSDRLKICRQVASLFALSTSSVAGEADNARTKAQDLVTKHGLTFSEVSPHCNEIALNVARVFWTNSESRPRPVFYGVDFAQDTDAISAEAVESILRNHYARSAIFGSPFVRYANPFFRPDLPPKTFATVSGVRRCVEDMDQMQLWTLVSQCDAYRGRIAGFRAEAHDALDADEYDRVEQIVRRMRGVPAPQSPETETALRRELNRRMGR